MRVKERATEDLAIFESHRPALVALAYRMLGDVGRAQDMVQEAWLRWHGRDVEVESPKAFLVTIVTRLCLNELDSARARREESRTDRLPDLLAADAVLITDGGLEGRAFRGIRNLRRPLEGAARGRLRGRDVPSRRARSPATRAQRAARLVFYQDGNPFAAVTLAVAEGKIHRVFFHADTTRLRNLGGSLAH